MAAWELTSKLGPFLDRHLVIPLLEFLAVKKIYDETDLLRGKLELFSNTSMVDFIIDVHKTLYPDQEVPKSLYEKRTTVVATFKRLQDENQLILKTFQDPKVHQQLQQNRDSKQLIDYLVQNHDFKIEMIDKCYEYAKCLYETGNYGDASKFLYIHRILVQPTDRNYLNGIWGKLASEILMQNWDAALEDLKRLQQFIDESTFGSSLQLLQQRTWLIHWSLFVFFNHPKGRDLIIELFLYQKQYLNAIQTTCPWILRYLSTAVIINKNSRRNVMKDLVKVIQEESYTYRDPITSFIEDLYVNFDFKGAQQKLRECRDVLFNDFFLVACLDDFIENSRLMIFETFCRIHQCISISMLAEKLNMGTEEAERWIVNLIRNAKLDAKIDSQLGHVVMGTQTTSPYEQLIERTKALSFRSQMLQLNVEKKKKAQDQPNWGTDGF
jgi:translation initiation factor 3 subunit E